MDAYICFDGTLPTLDFSTIIPPEGWRMYARKTGSQGFWKEAGYFGTKAEAEAHVTANGWRLVSSCE